MSSSLAMDTKNLPPLSFNQAERTQHKPRARGLTSIIDFGPDSFGWTGPAGVADYLNCVAEYIDYAKIYAMNALLLPATVVSQIVRCYREAGVTPYAGGILFEYAHKQGEFEGYVRHLKSVGMPQVEVSENYITLSAEQRRRYIGDLQAHGFTVIYEFGRKNPSETLSVEKLEQIVLDNVELGVPHTIIEQSEIDYVSARNPGILSAIVKSAWFHHVFIEADPYAFPKGHVELLDKFGKDVNLANITADQALRMQGFRYGIGRAVNYSLLEDQ